MRRTAHRVIGSTPTEGFTNFLLISSFLPLEHDLVELEPAGGRVLQMGCQIGTKRLKTSCDRCGVDVPDLLPTGLARYAGGALTASRPVRVLIETRHRLRRSRQWCPARAGRTS